MRLPFLALALAIFVGACAASSEATDSNAAAALSSADPITLGNFLNHPKIKEVRAEVDAVDAAKLTTVTADHTTSCADGTDELAKGTDAGGKIRKLVETAAGSDGDATTTYYYDGAGRLRFVFDVNEAAPANGELIVVESRVYFDASGARIFDVEKAGKGTTARPPNMANAPFSLPNDQATIPTSAFDLPDQVASDPAGFFATTPKCDAPTPVAGWDESGNQHSCVPYAGPPLPCAPPSSQEQTWEASCTKAGFQLMSCAAVGGCASACSGNPGS